MATMGMTYTMDSSENGIQRVHMNTVYSHEADTACEKETKQEIWNQSINAKMTYS